HLRAPTRQCDLTGIVSGPNRAAGMPTSKSAVRQTAPLRSNMSSPSLSMNGRLPERTGARTVRQGFGTDLPAAEETASLPGGNAVAKLLVIYKDPKDKDAFDSYYFSTHVPIAKKIPGLKKYSVSTGGIGSP